MKKHRNLIFYITTIGVFSVLIYCVLLLGKFKLESSDFFEDTVVSGSGWTEFIGKLMEDMSGPIAQLLVQIVVILLMVRLFGWICSKIGQPTVVGEIIAGVVLGPSLFGAYFPELSNALFPVSSLGNIGLLSQIGLLLFMFIVGMELDLKVLKNRANAAVVISHASIIFPFALGMILAYFMYEPFTHGQVHFISFALFMGIAMSITAFPVLARIVHERGMHKKPIGAMAITCAAIDDITAWCLLAAVIAIAKAGTLISALYVIGFAIVYVIVMLKLVRPFLKRVADLQKSKNIINKSVICIFFLVLFLSAYATEIMGIHALFGAFLAGVIMPANLKFRKLFIDKIEDVSVVLLLPLFFVYTGLRTQIGLLNEPYLWKVCGLIILIAVSGKFIGSTFAARFVGMNWHASTTIGALMNTRGLMELVVLNIGYDLGILSPEVFAMMVVMALVTTFMTSPLLNLIDRIFKKKEEEDTKTFKILVPFEDALIGQKLLLIAHSFIKKKKQPSELTMTHFSQGNNLYQYYIKEEEESVFNPVTQKAEALDQPIIPIFKITSDPYTGIIKMAKEKGTDWLLIGVHGSIYEGNLLGQFLGFSSELLRTPTNLLSWIFRKKRTKAGMHASLDAGTRSVISQTDCPVGIFIDKGLQDIHHVFIPVLSEDDSFIQEFIERLVENTDIHVTLWDANGLIDNSLEFIQGMKNIKTNNPYSFQFWNSHVPIEKKMLIKQDLMMVGIHSWKQLRTIHPDWFPDIPSTLILTE